MIFCNNISCLFAFSGKAENRPLIEDVSGEISVTIFKNERKKIIEIGQRKIFYPLKVSPRSEIGRAHV